MDKGTDRKKRIRILMVFLLVSGVVIWNSPRIFFPIGTSLGLYKIKMIETVNSPDGAWVLTAYDVGSGALGGNDLWVNLRRSTRPFRHHWGYNIMYVNAQPEFEVTWEETNDLQITLSGYFAKEERVLSHKKRVKDIRISYVLSPLEE